MPIITVGKNLNLPRNLSPRFFPLKKNLDLSTDDFWYDLTDGGYIKPEEMCKNIIDSIPILNAIKIIEEFKRSCEEQIEGFIR